MTHTHTPAMTSCPSIVLITHMIQSMASLKAFLLAFDVTRVPGEEQENSVFVQSTAILHVS